MAAKKVLIFTYYWPPAGGPGVQRFLKFCKYLGEYNWEPVVITVKDGSYPYEDSSLEGDIREGLTVIKTATREPFSLYNKLRGKKGKSLPVGMAGIGKSQSRFQKLAKYIRANYFIPDARKGWMKYAVKAASDYLELENVAAIITTGPPHSTHLTGMALQDKFGLPWLADFRDPWTNIYYMKYLPRTAKSNKKDRALETEVLQKADVVTVVSEGLKLEFQDRAKDIRVIYNGYDEADMRADMPVRDDHFTITYTGNLKANQDVPAMWEAMAEILNDRPELENTLRLELIGKIDPAIRAYLQGSPLQPVIHFQDFVPHHEATQKMVSATMLLFVVPETEKNELILTGKLFEYLASRTPMVSFGPVKGNAATILRECGRGEMLDYRDKSGTRERLINAIKTWGTHNRLPKHTGNAHEQYSRHAQTGLLASALDEINQV